VDETGAGSSGIDPSTGVPYADEEGSGGYGGIDPDTGVPYYDEITQSSTTTNPNAITTNQQWIETAESDAENLFGATSAVAESAVEAYMAQSSAGLPASSYTLMQSVVGELGQPPVGGPYRLIQSGAPTSTTGGTATLANSVGKVITLQSNIQSFGSFAKLAAHFHESVAHMQQYNPGVVANATTGTVNVQYDIKKGDTLNSIASLFEESPEHIEQVLQSQGIV
jgi:LysM repeat protein